MRIAIVVETGDGSTRYHGVHTFMIHTSQILKKLGFEIDYIMKKPKQYYQQSPKELEAIHDFSEYGKCHFPKSTHLNVTHCRDEWNQYAQFCLVESLALYLSRVKPQYLMFNMYCDVVFAKDIIIEHTDVETLYFNHSGSVFSPEDPNFLNDWYSQLLDVQNASSFKMLVPNKTINDYMDRLGFNTQFIMSPYNYTAKYTVPSTKTGIIAIGCGIPTKRTKEVLELLNVINIKYKIPCTVLTPESKYIEQYPNITIKQIPNNDVIPEIANHKLFLHFSSVDMMPYVFLEAAPVSKILVSVDFDWNTGIHEDIPLTRIGESIPQIIREYEAEYTNMYSPAKYSSDALLMWRRLLIKDE